jgi:hypothetical protein
MLPSVHVPPDEARVLEDTDVLAHGRLGQAETGRCRADGRRPLRELLDDRAPGGVREGEEAPIELRGTVHRWVNYICSAAMGRGSRPKVRWARDRQRKKKARDRAKAAPEQPAPRRRRSGTSS